MFFCFDLLFLLYLDCIVVQCCPPQEITGVVICSHLSEGDYQEEILTSSVII